MKIGIFDPYLDDLGGGEKYMMTIAEFLSKDNSVTVFWNNQADLEKISVRFSLDLSKVRVKDNIFSAKYPTFKRLVETLKYDAVIILSDGSLPLVFSKKLFIHFQQPFPKIKPSVGNAIKKIKVNNFFCNSVFTKTFIDKEFNVNSAVIYPPVDSRFIGDKKENIILHVGRFRVVNANASDYKKQKTMLSLFKKMVVNGLKDWKLVLAVGLAKKDQDEFNKLQEDAKGYSVEFFINLNKQELEKIYSKSKIYWHASGYGEDLQQRPELAEHFGITTVEAMSAGCVPVVINAGGQKEIIKNGENGLLWETLEEFNDKTLVLIKDGQLLNRLSKQAIISSGRFSKDNFCEEIRKMILK